MGMFDAFFCKRNCLNFSFYPTNSHFLFYSRGAFSFSPDLIFFFLYGSELILLKFLFIYDKFTITHITLTSPRKCVAFPRCSLIKRKTTSACEQSMWSFFLFYVHAYAFILSSFAAWSHAVHVCLDKTLRNTSASIQFANR